MSPFLYLTLSLPFPFSISLFLYSFLIYLSQFLPIFFYLSLLYLYLSLPIPTSSFLPTLSLPSLFYLLFLPHPFFKLLWLFKENGLSKVERMMMILSDSGPDSVMKLLTQNIHRILIDYTDHTQIIHRSYTESIQNIHKICTKNAQKMPTFICIE